MQFKIGGYCFGQNLNIIIIRDESSSLILSQVWQGLNGNSYIQPESAQIVNKLLITINNIKLLFYIENYLF